MIFRSDSDEASPPLFGDELPLEVAAIIPAYNEEATIASVVRTLRSSELFSEVVVISDGSTDATARRAREAGATMVHEFPERRGKGSAMLHGLRHTKATVVLFADADLRGLAAEHLRALLRSVVSGEAAMAVGLRDRGAIGTALERVLPLISGERALRREVLEAIPPRFLKGFQVEVAMNYHCRVRGWKVVAVPLAGLTIRTKVEKVGFLRALPQYGRMFWEVGSALVRVRLAHLRRGFIKN